MVKLNFYFDGAETSLGSGESLSSVPEKVYRDAPESLLGRLVEQLKSGSDWRALIDREIRGTNPWLAEIILSEKRNRFLNLVDCFGPNSLGLDVGAGWGQHTVDIAKKSKVCSIEPSPERFQFMKLICEQEGVAQNCFFVNSSLKKTEFGAVFDFAVSIGVLEWVGKFEECSTPYDAQLGFLRRIKSSLKQGAPLVLGIENRIGLKYLMGSNDDHIGLPHIMCLDFESAESIWKEKTEDSLKVATYSMSEYKDLFREAGFSDLVFYAALPDYKTPEQILECDPRDDFGSYISNNGFVPERDGSNGKDHGINTQLKSIYRTLAKEGMAPFFAPSYFIVAK